MTDNVVFKSTEISFHYKSNVYICIGENLENMNKPKEAIEII